MGEVWKARDSRLSRFVAVKSVPTEFSDRFQREANAIAALNHANICTLFDVGPNYLVMEWVEGRTLAARIAQGKIQLEEALRLAEQIVEALDAAHEKGITHRDLKPANIMIRNDGSVKVLDFGLAKLTAEAESAADAQTALSMDGVIMGTQGYTAGRDSLLDLICRFRAKSRCHAHYKLRRVGPLLDIFVNPRYSRSRVSTNTIAPATCFFASFSS